MCDTTKCARCGGEIDSFFLIDGVPFGDTKFSYLDRGYCTSVCEAFALRDQLKSVGAYTDEQGLDAEVWLNTVRTMRERGRNV
jgi:hypothetical protein